MNSNIAIKINHYFEDQLDFIVFNSDFITIFNTIITKNLLKIPIFVSFIFGLAIFYKFSNLFVKFIFTILRFTLIIIMIMWINFLVLLSQLLINCSFCFYVIFHFFKPYYNFKHLMHLLFLYYFFIHEIYFFLLFLGLIVLMTKIKNVIIKNYYY